MAVDPDLFDLDDFSFPLGGAALSPPPPPPPAPAGVWSPAAQVEWVFWPGREGLTHRSQGPLGSYASAALSLTHPYTGAAVAGVAKRRLPTAKEQAASGAVYAGLTAVWLVPALAFGTAPKPGDRLRDADTVDHTVLEAWTARAGATYHLRTIALSVVYALRSAGTLKRPANTATAGGKRTPALAELAADVPCRVQRTAARRDDAYDAPAARAEAVAYLGEQVFPEFGDVFACDGVTWAVDGWQDPDRLDQLMTLQLSARD